nr:unnamed protein product [Haemonchus contortus]
MLEIEQIEEDPNLHSILADVDELGFMLVVPLDEARAVSSLKDKEVALDNKPEELAQLSDSRTFVHEQDQELHVYYSERTIEMACTNGLYAIAADGVHTKQPKELMQLFCVHGVCNGGVEVPLLYSMTARKTEDVERRRDTCNLRKFMQGHGRVPVVAEWWDTIKGDADREVEIHRLRGETFIAVDKGG